MVNIPILNGCYKLIYNWGAPPCRNRQWLPLLDVTGVFDRGENSQHGKGWENHGKFLGESPITSYK